MAGAVAGGGGGVGGGALLSASLQDLLDRMDSREVLTFLRGQKLSSTLLRKLTIKLLAVQTVVDGREKRGCRIRPCPKSLTNYMVNDTPCGVSDTYPTRIRCVSACPRVRHTDTPPYCRIRASEPLGIATSFSLLSPRLKFVQYLKVEKPEGDCKPIPFELFLGNNQKEKSDPSEVGANILHPGYINTWRFLKRTIDSGGCVIAVPSAWSCARRFRLPRFLGKLFNCKQPETTRVSRDVNLHMPFGRLIRFLQFLRFNKTKAF